MSTNEDEEWEVTCSDEEKYCIKDGNYDTWEPDSQSIIKLFTDLDNKIIPEFNWKCPGRRKVEDLEKQKSNEEQTQNSEDDSSDADTSEPCKEALRFDMDDVTGDDKPITPRRIVGDCKTPRSNQKRVAQMDKIMSDLFKHNRRGDSRQNTPAHVYSPKTELNKLPKNLHAPNCGNTSANSTGENRITSDSVKSSSDRLQLNNVTEESKINTSFQSNKSSDHLESDDNHMEVDSLEPMSVGVTAKSEKSNSDEIEQTKLVSQSSPG